MSGTTYYKAEEESVIFTTKKMKLHIQITDEDSKIIIKQWSTPIRPSRLDELALEIIKLINNFRKPAQM